MVDQHGRLFIVLEHEYSCRDIMCIHCLIHKGKQPWVCSLGSSSLCSSYGQDHPCCVPGLDTLFSPPRSVNWSSLSKCQEYPGMRVTSNPSWMSSNILCCFTDSAVLSVRPGSCWSSGRYSLSNLLLHSCIFH